MDMDGKGAHPTNNSTSSGGFRPGAAMQAESGAYSDVKGPKAAAQLPGGNQQINNFVQQAIGQ